MRVTAVTQARSGSTRLPEKIFRLVGGREMLRVHLERLQQAREINQIIVATTIANEDQRVCALAESLGLKSYRGSEDDVLDRFYGAVIDSPPDYVVRVTSDCPLIDPALLDEVVRFTIEKKADYGSNVLKETFPDGQDVEVFTFDALQRAWKDAKLKSEREHVTPYIRKNSDYNGGTLFRAASYELTESLGSVRMTVDEEADLEVIQDVVDKLGLKRTWREYANFILNNNAIRQKNALIGRNEGYLKSIKQDKQ